LPYLAPEFVEPSLDIISGLGSHCHLVDDHEVSPLDPLEGGSGLSASRGGSVLEIWNVPRDRAQLRGEILQGEYEERQFFGALPQLEKVLVSRTHWSTALLLPSIEMAQSTLV